MFTIPFCLSGSLDLPIPSTDHVTRSELRQTRMELIRQDFEVSVLIKSIKTSIVHYLISRHTFSCYQFNCSDEGQMLETLAVSNIPQHKHILTTTCSLKRAEKLGWILQNFSQRTGQWGNLIIMKKRAWLLNLNLVRDHIICLSVSKTMHFVIWNASLAHRH